MKIVEKINNILNESPIDTEGKNKNLASKTRKIDNPYEIWENNQGWEWKVLKKYQSPDKEKGNPYARWFCAVKSPFTFGSYEYGDVYVKDIVNGARKVKENY